MTKTSFKKVQEVDFELDHKGLSAAQDAYRAAFGRGYDDRSIDSEIHQLFVAALRRNSVTVVVPLELILAYVLRPGGAGRGQGHPRRGNFPSRRTVLAATDVREKAAELRDEDGLKGDAAFAAAIDEVGYKHVGVKLKDEDEYIRNVASRPGRLGKSRPSRAKQRRSKT